MGYIVTTLVNGIEVDKQAVDTQTELIDNDFVVFNKEQELSVNGGDVFSGGVDGISSGESHEKARAAFESTNMNVIAVPTTDKGIQDAYIEYVKSSREDGIKFQIVMPSIEREFPINHEGVIEYVNEVTNPINDAQVDLCYWLAGAEAGCKVQSSCTAKAYDGTFKISSRVTREDQTKAIRQGKILFHSVGDDSVILRDINTLIKINAEDVERKHKDFSNNQVIRTLDGISTESATVFNSYFLGKRQNTSTERASLALELQKIREKYAQIGAIDTYDASQLVILPGQKPNEVIGRDAIRPLQCMDILYLQIVYQSAV